MNLFRAVIYSSALISFSAGHAATLDIVRGRGELVCGVTQGVAGFSAPDDQGTWRGFDVDFCRAVAAAVLGDASKVEFIPLSAKERFTALQSGEVDLLSRATTWTLSRDASLGLNFRAITLYDGQAFLVPSARGVRSAADLEGGTVCTPTGTTTELNATDFFRSRAVDNQIISFETLQDATQSYSSGRCDALTVDRSQLQALRLELPDAEAHIILPENVSKEPLGPVVRQGDDQWLDIVSWTHYAMVAAEELGVTSHNIEQHQDSENPEIRRMLGTEGNFGEQLGLTSDWAYRIIEQVGNYGEIFDLNLGAASRLDMDRGLNRLWTEGGLQYAPPFR